nr:RNase adapter RapZ [Desulfobacterales bacterium]
MKNLNIIIITGLSGSGKSTAIKALEDVGYFCIDNLPIFLLPKFLELRLEGACEITKLALVMDLREKEFLHKYSEVFSELRKQGYKFEILFLEASTETLLRRYSQTRRYHPLAGDKTIREGIEKEREQLKDLRKIADKVVDTSYFNVHDLKSFIEQYVSKTGPTNQLRVHILSFGFKYGIPNDADMIMDIRFLPNPYFVPELRPLDGRSSKVKAYVKRWKETNIFLEKFMDLLYYTIPLYQKEGKSHLTIGIGCTGGKHRSVTVAEEIFSLLRQKVEHIDINHRDIDLA